MSAKQVVAAAAKLGMKISAAYVSNIRSHAKVRQRGAGAETRRSRQGAAPAGATVSAGDAEFRQLVLQLGVSRANQLVAEVDAKLAAIIQGQ